METNEARLGDLSTIEKSLRAGCKLHTFRSGGGLRVVRLETQGGTLKGYGEHPHIEVALAHAAEDYEAGQRDYDDVYGKLKDHYLTGSSSPSNDLDLWVLKGYVFDARAENDEIVVELLGYTQVELPEDVKERLKTADAVLWEQRGYVVRCANGRFPNGEACVRFDYVKLPERDPRGLRVLNYKTRQLGRGGDAAGGDCGGLRRCA